MWRHGRTPPLSAEERARWQKLLDAVCGTRGPDKPVVKLVWGWETFDQTEAGRLPRYQVDSTEEGDPICISRWILEQRIEPEAMEHTWEASRYAQLPDGTMFDALGALPREGYYTFLAVLAEHEPDHACCMKRQRIDPEAVCHGWYRPPIEQDLIELAERIAFRDREHPDFDPFLPVNYAAAQRESRAAMERQAAQDKKDEEEYIQFWQDEFNTHRNRLFSDDPTVNSHGSYHFVKGFKESASGLLVPESALVN